jgi:glycosyltransferase involved in cell wall biosynthesis
VESGLELERLRLTVAICACRADNLRAHLRGAASSIDVIDPLIVVFDGTESDLGTELRCLIQSVNAMLVVNGANRGLSYSRNVVLDICQTDHLLFIDDDVLLTKSALSAIRSALAGGFPIVGMRLLLPSYVELPWFISAGQLHYLAVHAPWEGRPWGACMAFDVRLARRTGARFRPELGRRGGRLECGDDTTFLESLRRMGGHEKLVSGVGVVQPNRSSSPVAPVHAAPCLLAGPERGQAAKCARRAA